MPLNRINLSKYVTDCFVETGTHTGEGVYLALKAGFENIHTIEKDSAMIPRMRPCLRDDRVRVHIGDSAELLDGILSGLAGKSVTIWLDAHPPGLDLSLHQSDLPLLRELAAIKRHIPDLGKVVLMIDDMRIFAASDRAEMVSLVEKMLPFQPITFGNGAENGDVLISAPEEEPPPLGCFVYLLKTDDEHIKNICESLRLLHNNFIAAHSKYPVYVFHESTLGNANLEAVASASGITPVFVEIEFGVPSHIDESQIHAASPLGYKHMCRFFSNQVFNDPNVAKHMYYCRMDSDSMIRDKIVVDIFESAKDADLGYGYVSSEFYDNLEYSIGLWNVAALYFASNPSRYNQLGNLKMGRCFYNNIEVCKTAWFRSDKWRKFFEYIDAAGGIYYERWGDHTIRFIGVCMMMHPNRIRKISGVHYEHQKFSTKIGRGGAPCLI